VIAAGSGEKAFFEDDEKHRKVRSQMTRKDLSGEESDGAKWEPQT